MDEPLLELQQRYIDRHKALGHSVKTQRHYQDSFDVLNKWIEATGKPMDTSVLTSAQLDQFAGWLRETPTRGWRGSTTRTPHGIFGILKDLKAFVRYLLEEEIIERNVKVPLPKLPQMLFPVLTKEEIDRIWQTPQMTYRGAMGKRNRALLALMLDTGLRRAEVVNLKVEDVNFADQLVTVTGKGSKQRRVPFSTAVRDLLHDWISARGDDPRSLFLLKPAGVRQLFRRIQDQTGIEHFHPHACRHTAATSMVRSNLDTHSVKRILGHSSIVVTERYLSLSDEDLRAKHAAASPFDALVAPATVHAPIRRKRPSRFE
jgi:site-specific recombinase XerD